MNKTYIALIPKTKNHQTPAEYRPISLCNTIYKVISKCMVNRLKGLMSSLIGENQNAFTPGRLMSDNCLITHEIVSMFKKKEKIK